MAERKRMKGEREKEGGGAAVIMVKAGLSEGGIKY